MSSTQTQRGTKPEQAESEWTMPIKGSSGTLSPDKQAPKNTNTNLLSQHLEWAQLEHSLKDIGDDHEADDNDSLPLMGLSKRSSYAGSASSFSTGMTSLTSGMSSCGETSLLGDSSLGTRDSMDDSSKKKKSKKKSKKSSKSDKTKDSKVKKEKSKKKKDRRPSDTDHSEGSGAADTGTLVITERDEKMVEDLCGFLTDTLSTAENTESFIRMLGEEGNNEPPTSDAPCTIRHSGNQPVSSYAVLASPGLSVCPTVKGDASMLRSIFPPLTESRNEQEWTAASPPSVANGIGAPDSPKPPVPFMVSGSSTSEQRTLEDMTTPLSPPRRELSQGVERVVASTGGASEDAKTSSPEGLFLALPKEFRSYLLGLHTAELQQEKPDAPPPISTIEGPLSSRDDISIASELTGMTALQLKPVKLGGGSRQPAQFMGGPFPECDTSDDDDSDSDDDSSVDSSALLMAARHFTSPRLDAEPRRSSFASKIDVDPMTCPEAANIIISPKKRVRFDVVQVREHDTVLDNNPSCSEGPAIALGWVKTFETTFPIDEFDHAKKHRRYHDDLVLSKHTREGILIKSGYTKTDMAKSTRNIIKARNQRRRTVQSVGVQNLEYAMQRVGRRFKVLLSKKSTAATTA